MVSLLPKGGYCVDTCIPKEMSCIPDYLGPLSVLTAYLNIQPGGLNKLIKAWLYYYSSLRGYMFQSSAVLA